MIVYWSEIPTFISRFLWQLCVFLPFGIHIEESSQCYSVSTRNVSYKGLTQGCSVSAEVSYHLASSRLMGGQSFQVLFRGTCHSEVEYCTFSHNSFWTDTTKIPYQSGLPINMTRTHHRSIKCTYILYLWLVRLWLVKNTSLCPISDKVFTMTAME